MNAGNLYTAEFYLHFRLPGEFQMRQLAVSVDADLHTCLAPLPSDREVAWAPKAKAKASEMQQERAQLAAMLAKTLTAILIKAIEARDPINGYSPEEWRQIQATQKHPRF